MDGRAFGQQYIMHTMVCRSGLLEMLRDVYGDATGRGIAAVAVTHASDIVQHRYLLEEVRRGAARELCGAPLDLNLGGFSGINEAAVHALHHLEDLFQRLDAGEAATVMELVSLEEGFSHVSSNEGFRQRSVPGSMLYLGINGVMGTPFYYGFRESSEDRFRAVSEVYSNIRGMAARPIHFVLGRRRSRKELAYMVDHGVTFTTVVDEELWMELGEGGPTDESSAVIEGCVFRFRERTARLGEGEVRMLEVLNENVRSDQDEMFLRRIEEFGRVVSKLKWGSSVRKRLGSMGYGDMVECMELSRAANGFTACAPIGEAVRSRMDSHGIILIVTTSGLQPKDLGTVLIRRGRFEWELAEFRRNQLNAPERLSTEQTTRGMFLLDFLRMILKSQLNLELSRTDARMSPDDALDVMKGIRVNHTDGGWILDDLTERQRALLRRLDIRMPDSRLAEAVMSGGAP